VTQLPLQVGLVLEDVVGPLLHRAHNGCMF